jgi:hypothetical protein
MKDAGETGLAPPTPEKGANLWMPPTFPPRVSFRCAPRNPLALVNDDDFGENHCTVVLQRMALRFHRRDHLLQHVIAWGSRLLAAGRKKRSTVTSDLDNFNMSVRMSAICPICRLCVSTIKTWPWPFKSWKNHVPAPPLCFDES